MRVLPPHLPKWLVRAAIISVSTGTGLAGLGLYLDTRDWWSHHPYATNMYSTLSGALLGLPVSVIVVATILDSARDHRERVRALLAIDGALRRLLAAARGMLGVRDVDASRLVKSDREANSATFFLTVLGGPIDPANKGAANLLRNRLDRAPDQDTWAREVQAAHAADRSLEVAARAVDRDEDSFEREFGMLHEAVRALNTERAATSEPEEILRRARQAASLHRAAELARDVVRIRLKMLGVEAAQVVEDRDEVRPLKLSRKAVRRLRAAALAGALRGVAEAEEVPAPPPRVRRRDLRRRTPGQRLREWMWLRQAMRDVSRR